MDNTMPILLVPGLGGSPRIYAPVAPALWRLALQLPTCFEMRTLSGGLVSSAPE